MNIEEKYHEPILAFLERNGESGVNAIAAGIGMPLTSVQKYLNRQTYFKKTMKRQWDLPERVTEKLATDQETNRLKALAQSLQTQVLLLNQGLEMHVASMADITKQIESISPMLESFTPSVAESSHSNRKFDPRLIEIQDKCDNNMKAIKAHKANIPEVYLEMLLNLDSIAISLSPDKDELTRIMADEIVPLITGNSKELSDYAVDMLLNYQINTSNDKDDDIE